MRKFLAAALAVLTMLCVQTSAQTLVPANARDDGDFIASRYAWGYGQVKTTNSVAVGAGTVILSSAAVALPDGSTIYPFAITAPITIDGGTAVSETVLPTAVSGCSTNAPNATCSVTATFANAHGPSASITSGTFGLQEAIDDAVGFSGSGGVTTGQGGEVVVDKSWGGTTAQLSGTAASGNVTLFQGVTIADKRTGTPIYWTPTPTGLAVATPTTLTAQAACDATHQFCSDANVAGSASWSSTVYGCVAYVDIFGNEGPCSATASFTSVASKAIDVAAPAASPGAVGYVVYLSLSGGTYALAYQVPSTSANCTLTTLETITPACAVANATYGQAASTFGADALFTKGGSQIGTYPVSTAEMYPVLATTAQTITAQHPLTNSSVTFAYAPASRVGNCGFTSLNMVQLSAAGGISGSSATTVPQPVGSWSIPSGCFNYVGAEFRVSGKFVYTDGGSGTSTKVIVSWEANGTNTASVPTPLCSILDTFTSAAAADNVNYVCTFRVLTAGATGTGLANGISAGSIAAGQTTLVRNALDNAVAASAAINLATNARISVQFQATGATSNPGAQALEGTLEVLN